MKIYKQAEWMKIVDDKKGKFHGLDGHISLGDIAIINNKIAWIEGSKIWGGFSAEGNWSSNCIGQDYIGVGNYEWQLEDDFSLSLVQDGKANPLPKFNHPNIKMGKPIVIPFKKWFDDFAKHQHEYGKIYNQPYGYKTEYKGFGIRDGIVKNVIADKITDYNWKSETEICLNDVMYNYGILSPDILCGWIDHAYFDDDLNVVFDAKYVDYVNVGYYVYDKNYKLAWKPTLDFLPIEYYKNKIKNPLASYQ